MSRNRYYYYDPEACTYVESVPGRRRLVGRIAMMLGVGIIFAGIALWGVDRYGVTPEELALRTENEALQLELSSVSTRLDGLTESIGSLEETDETLYRTILDADPISDDVRKAGVGGSDPYSAYARFSAPVAQLLTSTSSRLDELERKVGIQNASYRELDRLAAERVGYLEQVPALLPADGIVTSGYKMRLHPILRVRRMHKGIDVLLPTGTPVHAAGAGVVFSAEYNSGFGYHVKVRHPKSGHMTVYAHLSEIGEGIEPGTPVLRGQELGLSGNTGLSSAPHLHYEVRNLAGTEAYNPMHFVLPSMTPSEYQEALATVDEATTSMD